MGSARDTLVKNRQDAMKAVTQVGGKSLAKTMKEAHADLATKLARTPEGTFTAARMEATMSQIQDVLKSVVMPGLEDATMDAGMVSADYAAGGIVEYMERAEMEFAGVGFQPLAIREASVLNAAKMGARSSLLRRLATSGTGAPNADIEAHAAKMGIVDRYGLNVINDFEETLQKGMIARKSMIEMRGEIIGKSPFLQGKPSWWATRIVRTESAGAYNRSAWESMREINDELEDMVKINSAINDSRTGSDSLAVHGQVRMLDEPFDTWFGPMMTPPDRSNDRSVVVAHRMSWPLPAYLKPFPPEMVIARWIKEGRKDEMPEIPEYSTVDVSKFGESE